MGQHLQFIETKYHSLIKAEIGTQPVFEPDVQKQETEAAGAASRLCGGMGCCHQNRFRVFYQINSDAREVQILAIGVKDRNRLLIGGEAADI